MKCIILIITLQSVFSLGNGKTSNIIRLSQKSRRLPQLDACGKFTPAFDNKVYTARPAGLGEFPWMAALGYVHGEDFIWGCGGSLITNQYVITAAHCLLPESIGAFILDTVRLGEMDINDEVVDGASPIDFRISNWMSHPKYRHSQIEHDIGLVRLKRKVTFTDNIRPICLPPPQLAYNEYFDYLATTAGWGLSFNTTKRRHGTQLYRGDVTIKDTHECITELMSTTEVTEKVTKDRIVCTSGYPVESCQGDSGGPLMWYIRPDDTPPGSQGNMYLMGLATFGHSCAAPECPEVYTRVSKYMSWIITHLDI